MYNAKKFGKVAVLAGGPSSERPISLESGKAVYKALKEAGCDAVWVDLSGHGAEEIIRKISPDIAFLALHGRFGEDGTLQKILEKMAVPYTGSGVNASRLALDKIASKKIFDKSRIPTPPYRILEGRTAKKTKGLSFPLVVKPESEGSSIGLSLVLQAGEFSAACNEAFKYGDKIIVEKFIRGREITVGILGDTALPVIEIVPDREFYDFYAKYKDKNTKYVVPAHIPRRVAKKARALGLKAHRTLKCSDFSRVDMILGDDGKLFVLEVNTIPGLTARSLLPKAAGAIGINFNDLCLRFLSLALKNNGKKT